MAITIVASNITDYNVTTISLNGVVVNDQLVLIVNWSYRPTPPSVSADSLGNVWTRHAESYTSVGQDSWYSFTATAAASGNLTLTISGAAGIAKLMAIADVSGIEAAPFDQQANQSNTTSPVQAGSVTPTQNGALILATWQRNGVSAAYSQSGSFALLQTSASNALAYYVQPSAASINPAVNGSASAAYPNYGYCVSLLPKPTLGGLSLTLLGCGA